MPDNSIVQKGFMSPRRRGKSRDPDEDKNRGTVLKQAEHQVFDAIAEKHGFGSGHQVRQFALRWFLQEYDAGRVEIPVEEVTSRRPAMPGGEESES